VKEKVQWWKVFGVMSGEVEVEGLRETKRE